MQTAISRDGTPIAFERSGEGPALVLVGGALTDRRAFVNLAAALAADFTVFVYDRRGRGDSGDTPPYSVQREIDDLDALVGLARSRVLVYGHSSGAALGLEAAARGVSIARLALYEPPFIVDTERPGLPDRVPVLAEVIAAGRRDEAVAGFLQHGLDVPPQTIDAMRTGAAWPALESMAHTLLYDGAVMDETMRRGRGLARFADVSVPVLVMSGGASPERFRRAAMTVAEILPDARHVVVEGQGHAVESAVLAPILRDFFLTRPLP